VIGRARGARSRSAVQCSFAVFVLSMEVCPALVRASFLGGMNMEGKANGSVQSQSSAVTGQHPWARGWNPPTSI
jgi:hypothetical protein